MWTAVRRLNFALLLAIGANAEVVTVTEANVDNELNKMIVKFYAPWCGHCKKLHPLWEQLGQADLKDVRVGRVDCTREKKPCEKYAIRAFPTILYFPGKGDGKIFRYQGARTIEDMSAFVSTGYKEAEEYDPSKVPPPPPRKTTLETIYMVASKNWVATGFFLLICVVVVLLRCLFPKAVEQHLEEDAAFDDDDTSSPSFGSRTFGNVPLSQQQTRSVAAAATSGKAGVPKARTFDNVPLSQQKPHAD